ncbi:unnamed protein product [Gongylonema pulchrum]|uniref:Uncharacterized protein n=1 Tax=Gongylonema pulchrum TaxID=637853 RepID=A0A3P6QQ90_9BILA|nr:unnamed protein product [Gongylonema pulchrum]
MPENAGGGGAGTEATTNMDADQKDQEVPEPAPVHAIEVPAVQQLKEGSVKKGQKRQASPDCDGGACVHSFKFLLGI